MARLAAEGHRSVLYITRPVSPVNIRNRVLGQVGKDLEMSVATESLLPGQPDGAYRQPIEEHLKLADPPTVFFTDAGTLPPVVQALQDLGLEVPDDISLVTFDESLWQRRLSPPWATIGFDGQDFGRTAGSLMADFLDGKTPPDIYERRGLRVD